MGAKFKSKTHLLNTVGLLVFGAVLLVWVQSLEKVLTWPKKCFNKKIYQKTQNFMLISNPMKKFFFNVQQKCFKQNKFDEHE